jgi:plastocyanin
MFSVRLALLSAVLVCAAACSDYSTPSGAPSPAPSPTPMPGGPSSPVAIPVGAESLGNRAYAPDEVTVAAGTTVTWTNTDSVSHTTASDAREWNSGVIAPGGQYAFAFQTAGIFPYHCAIHPGMIGTVVVR